MTKQKSDNLDQFTKLSDLIDAAVDDMIACQEEGMHVDMDHWYVESETRQLCSICFAGGIMAQRMNLPSDGEADITRGVGACATTEHSPYSLIGLGIIHKLEALNYVRKGQILSAFRQFYRGANGGDGYSVPASIELLEPAFGPLEYFTTTPYEADPSKFVSDMRNVARLFRYIGF